MPAVRGYRKLTITAVQIAVGTVGASVVGVATATAFTFFGLTDPGSGSMMFVCLVTGIGELSYRVWGHPRPLALNRQVPRYWGHQNGPWKAAVRYGLRMGVGPATILTSWTWWCAVVVCAMAGPMQSVLGAFVFVTTRFVVSSLSSLGVADGSAMARRSAKLDAFRVPVERMVLAVPFLSVFGLLFAKLAS